MSLRSSKNTTSTASSSSPPPPPPPPASASTSSTTSSPTPTGIMAWYRRPKALIINFVAMTLCFSINHGTVTALLALASANLGDSLGGYQSGVLYVTYTLSALTVAACIVNATGSKWGLFTSLLLYVAYVASFLAANMQPSVKWYAALGGSAVGGFAAGWLWTAQVICCDLL